MDRFSRETFFNRKMVVRLWKTPLRVCVFGRQVMAHVYIRAVYFEVSDAGTSETDGLAVCFNSEHVEAVTASSNTSYTTFNPVKL